MGTVDATVAVERMPRTLDEAVQWTVVYADIFDYPLTREEVYTFLVGVAGARPEVDAALDRALLDGQGLETDGQFVYLEGRAAIVEDRLRRGRAASAAWRHARVYAQRIWALPYVRMVAVTGALAMNNVEEDDDIDFLVVTEPGRLWTTRGMIVLLCKLARLSGHTLCPNYLLSARALAVEQRDLYAAHELAQMVPLHGMRVAEGLWTANAWSRSVLPNARCSAGDGTEDGLARPLSLLKRLVELVLRSPPGELLEGWERDRKIAKLSRQVPPDVRETAFTADVCKGHDRGHGSRIMRRFTTRLEHPG